MSADDAWAALDVLRAMEAPAAMDTCCSDMLCVCGGTKVLNDHDGIPVCLACGRCDSAWVSEEPEWRGGGGDDGGTKKDACRVGTATNLDLFSSALSMGTIMTAGPRGNAGQKRLVRMNFNMSMGHRDRALYKAYTGIEEICTSHLRLPPTVIYAIKIKYRKFSEGKLTRGAVRQGVKANCVYQACQEHGIARTTQEIAEAFGIPARDLSRTYDLFQEVVPEAVESVNVTTPAALISRLFNSVTCIPDAERGRAKMKIVSTCQKLESSVALMGRTPKAVACAVMYVLLEGKVTKVEICEICDVSGPTLKKIESIVRAELKELVA
jgi:transcription initiation factor TFIIIB Brf1 subunit/transcription initiation factor TFIIB